MKVGSLCLRPLGPALFKFVHYRSASDRTRSGAGCVCTAFYPLPRPTGQALVPEAREWPLPIPHGPSIICQLSEYGQLGYSDVGRSSRLASDPLSSPRARHRRTLRLSRSAPPRGPSCGPRGGDKADGCRDAPLPGGPIGITHARRHAVRDARAPGRKRSSYLSSTLAPPSSICFWMSAASSLGAPSLIVTGADSTMPLASCAVENGERDARVDKDAGRAP